MYVIVYLALLTLFTASGVNSKELQSIIYKPESCARDYLLRLNKRLKKMSELLFTPERASVVGKFESQYSVQVNIQDSFPAKTYEQRWRIEYEQSQKQNSSYSQVSTPVIFPISGHGTFVSASVPYYLA